MNRREALASMAFAGAAVAIPVTAFAQPRPGRAAWDRAMADYQRAKAAWDAYDDELERITQDFVAARDKVPHVTIKSAYHGKTLSTADSHEVAWQRRSCTTLRYVEDVAYDGVKISQQFVDAADKREAIIAKIDKQLGYSAAHDKDEAFGIAVGDLETVLLDMPAPDGEALLWKVNRLYAPGEGIWTEGVEDQTIADLHRFLLNGRA